MSTRLRLLITGASGWIGSAVVRAALREGARFDLFLSDIAPGPGDPPFLAGDLCEKEFADCLLGWAQPDTILHLAGTNHNAPYDRHWLVNIGGTVGLLEAATARAWDGHFVNLGSAAEYGITPGLHRYAETTPCYPRGGYGISKHLQHQALGLLRERAPWRATHFRLFNPVGPGMRPHLMLGRLVAQLVAAPAEQDPVPVELWTGYPQRDYIAIGDVAAILLRAAVERWETDLANIGTGQATSVRDVVGSLARVIGRRIEVTYTRPDLGADDVIVADVTRLTTQLGDDFVFTPLENVLQQVWAAANPSFGSRADR